jgi:thiamine-phosphate pyrophosphorylase
MMLNLSKPILYLITRGATGETTTTESAEFRQILRQVSVAVTAGIQLIQIREKKLPSRVLYELTTRVVSVTQATATRVLVNDRADIAASAGAHGVHLTTQSLEAAVVRQVFGDNFLIGSSTHSLSEARRAREGGADFIVFGPVFESPSKKKYGPPLGLQALSEVAGEVTPFPVLALGGVTIANAPECLRAGASGIAGIGLFSKPESLATVAVVIRKSGKGVTN